MIEGNIIKVLQVMACNYGWISDFYHEPIENINRNKINRNLSPEIIVNNVNRRNRNNIRRNNNNNFHIPQCCQFFICIIIIILVLVFSAISNKSITINF